jgi:SAM-dependent methyltransferase
MSQEEYWDKVAGKKEFTVKFKPELFAQYVGTSGRVLDFGCGYGRTLRELHDRGFKKLYGIDLSAKMLELTAGQIPEVELAHSTDLTIPFDNDFFDAVILLAVLTSIRSDVDQQKLIGEIYRCLKPGGILYAGDFLLNEDTRNIERYKTFEPKYSTYGVFELDEGAVLRHHSEEYIKRLLSCFEDIHFQKVVHYTMNGHTSNGFVCLARKAE